MKVEFGQTIPGASTTRALSTSEIIVKLRYIKEHLTYQQAYAHYNFPWLSNDTHQISCPFHATNVDAHGVPYENHPSARYYEGDRQIWCFACVEGGDVSWFIRKMEDHAHYGETVDFISKNFGVGLSSGDLSKRIALHEQKVEQSYSPRRQLLSKMYEDKVNDEFYKLRQMGDAFLNVADRLEPEVFDHKAELDNHGLKYMEYARAVRRWLSWTQELIQTALKHLARTPNG